MWLCANVLRGRRTARSDFRSPHPPSRTSETYGGSQPYSAQAALHSNSSQRECLPPGDAQCPSEVNLNRRQLLGPAAATATSAQLGLIAPANTMATEPSTEQPANPPTAQTPFASVKQIDAGPLNIGYAEAGAADAPAATPKP
jgi:hypothetical protein